MRHWRAWLPPAWLCLDWLHYFGGARRASQQEYRRQIDQAFGHVIPSPWADLRQGLVLGGEARWNRARELLDQAEGHEEIRWRRRADGDEVSRLIASLVAQEADRRVAVWLRVRMGGQAKQALFGTSRHITQSHPRGTDRGTLISANQR